MNEEAHNELDIIFLGRETILTSGKIDYGEFDKSITAAVEKQNVIPTEINYAVLISDIYIECKSFIDGFKLDSTEVENIKEDNRVLITHLVISLDDRHKDAEHYYRAYLYCYFVRNFYVTLKLIHNIEVIANFEPTIRLVQQYEDKYFAAYEQQNTEMIIQDRDVHIPDENDLAEEPKPKKVVYFKCSFNSIQKSRFISLLREHDLTTTPAKVYDFLNGNNDAEFKLNESKMLHWSYLIHRLYHNSPPFIRVSSGGGFYQHFHDIASQNKAIMGNYNLTDLRRRVLGGKFKKTHIQQEVDGIMHSLQSKKVGP